MLVADTQSTDTMYSDTTLSGGETQHCRVSAINSIDTGAASTVANATTASGPGVGTVTSGSITRTTAVITVTIANPDTNSQTVNLQYKRNADTAWTDVSPKSTVSNPVTFILSGLTGNTDYDVRASLDSTFASGVVTATFKTSPTAPAPPTLVSNTGQTATGAAYVRTNPSSAQGFTTGTNSGGYTLGSVELAVKPFDGTASDIIVSIHSEGSGNPGTLVHILTMPGSLSDPVTTFSAPSGTTLAASTTYYVVISTTSTLFHLSRTEATAEDTGGASGWSIADDRRFSRNLLTWSTATVPLRMRINGTAGVAALTDATLSSLVLNDGTNDLTLTPTFASGTTATTSPRSSPSVPWAPRPPSGTSAEAWA